MAIGEGNRQKFLQLTSLEFTLTLRCYPQQPDTRRIATNVQPKYRAPNSKGSARTFWEPNLSSCHERLHTATIGAQEWPEQCIGKF